MAGTNRQTPDHLIDELERNPFAFDFYRAVRLLESTRPDLPRVGQSLSPKEDALRFRQNPSLEFPPSSLEKLRRLPEKDYAELFVRFFGLFGANAPLPPHLTDYARERILHHDDHTFSAFLDVFHHRLVSFFYRAWAANQKTADFDRPKEASFPLYVGSFFGIGMESLQNQDAVQDSAKLFFSGRLAPAARNAEGLEAILGEYLGIKAEVHSFVGRYMNLPEDSLCRIGGSPETGSLGVNSIVGTRFYECQLNFRIRLGPMSRVDYERLLPGGSAFERVRYWVLNYCGEHFFWDLQLVLKAEEVPSTRCGGGARLGWTTWLSATPPKKDADDLIVTPPN